MFLMLWVNDFAGMSGIPHWMGHALAEEDMMGFSDLIFPSFLFCMGMSVPLAINSRKSRGAGTGSLLLHIAVRSFALILMGIFSMNIRGSWFEILMVAGFFLLWNDYRFEGSRKWLRYVLMAAGGILICGLLIHARPLRIGWWGILGLIGWAYLATSVVYLCLQRSTIALAAAWAVIIALVLLSHGPCSALGAIPGGWTHIGISFTGAMCTLAMLRIKDSRRLCICLLAGAAVAFACGALTHRWWHISKILATPSWMFHCIAVDLLLMCALNLIANVRGWTAWARPIKAAGTATLTCYTLPYLWYPLCSLAGIRFPHALTCGVPGLMKAAVFSLLVILLAEGLSRAGIKLKL